MNRKNVPLRITVIYLIMSLSWSMFSESFISAVSNNSNVKFSLDNIEQYVFILITSAIIYWMTKKESQYRNNIENDLLEKVNIIKSSQDAIIGSDLNGIITSWNPRAEKVFGYSSSKAIGGHISLIFSDSRKHLIPIIIGKLNLGEIVDSIQTIMVSKSKIEIPVSVTVSPIRNTLDEISGISFIIVDMTRQKEDENKLKLGYEELMAVYEQLAATEEELRAQYEELQENQNIIRKSEERFKLALEGANDVIWEWNPSTDEIFISDKWHHLTGFRSNELLCLKDTLKFVHPEDRDKASRDLKDYMKGITPFYQSEIRIVTIDGEVKWISNRGKMSRVDNGTASLMAGSTTDITERMKKQDQIIELAYYDSVTRLPNRILFTNRLKEELNKTKKSKTKGMAVFLDLDDFKKVNDTLGHDYGDELLKSIGRALKDCIGENNTVARFGGDEFLVLVPIIEERIVAIELAKKILNNFSNAFQVGEKQIYVTASAGIAIYPEDGDTVQAVLKNIDTAMYAAKEKGKNTYYFFDKHISEAVLRRSEVEKGLRNALKKNELILHYQPQVDIKTGRIHGLEALIRWNSAELGFVSPMEFVPIAEETGLINELGEWIIRTACRESKRLKSMNYDFDTISVNVSAIQLQQSNFVEVVRRILEEEQLDPSYLEIEITESILMKSLEDNVKSLNDLRKNGVKTALDDFGTGYSSLSYLRMLPLSTLKIDRSFIEEICHNESDKDITDGIIQLAHKINLDVVIEGVEDREQVELLMGMGCNLIQGYYFSKPLPIDGIEELFKKNAFKI